MRYLWVFLGFVLLMVGFCSMILDALGLQFTFMAWMAPLDGIIRFIIYIIMCFGGVALAYLNTMNWRYDPDMPVEDNQKDI